MSEYATLVPSFTFVVFNVIVTVSPSSTDEADERNSYVGGVDVSTISTETLTFAY